MKDVSEFIQVEGIETIDLCLKYPRTLLVVGSLDDVVEHRFADRKIRIIKDLATHLEDKCNLSKLIEHIKEVRAIVLVVVDDDQKNALPESLLEKIDFTVYSKQRDRKPCWTFCVERLQAAKCVDMTRVSQTNNDDDFECCGWCVPEHSLFHCMYDGDMSFTERGYSTMFTDCRDRCQIEDSPIEEHKKRGKCKDGETLYEQFGYTFQTEDSPPTFHGKEIR